ncbi:MAG: hypothetical protein ACOX1F_04865 [Erysipelotrichaceae bacterium]|jgi:cell division septum initiation protein DivIVA
MLYKEINEAYYAGLNAQKALDEALYYLEQAKDFGILDITGGKLIISASKYKSINKANKFIDDFVRNMKSFAGELLDVRLTGNLKVEISDFLRITDIYFDQLLSDTIVQKKITDSLKMAQELKPKVDDIVLKLKELSGN